MSDVMNKSTQRRALAGRDFNQLIFIVYIYIFPFAVTTVAHFH